MCAASPIARSRTVCFTISDTQSASVCPRNPAEAGKNPSFKRPLSFSVEKFSLALAVFNGVFASLRPPWQFWHRHEIAFFFAELHN